MVSETLSIKNYWEQYHNIFYKQDSTFPTEESSFRLWMYKEEVEKPNNLHTLNIILEVFQLLRKEKKIAIGCNKIDIHSS